MDLPEMSAVCSQCRARFVVRPKRTLLAFQSCKCLACNASVIYPLTRGYRVFYQFVLVMMVLASLRTLAKGDIPLPGVFGVIAIVALFQDKKIKNQVARAEALPPRPPSRPANPSLVPPATQKTSPPKVATQAPVAKDHNTSPQTTVESSAERGAIPQVCNEASEMLKNKLAEANRICQTCNNEMIRRRATNGPHTGKLFWVCSAFPKCKTVVPVTEAG